MDPMTIMLASQVIPMLIKGGTSIAQNARAKSIEQSSQRPEYSVPGAVNEAVSSARMDFNDPNLYALSLAQENIGQNAAQALRAAKESGAGPNATIAAASAINTGMNDASRNLAISADQQRQQKLRTLLQALGNKGAYQDKAFFVNEMEPYMDNQLAARELRYASRGNLDSLMGDVVNAGANSYMGSVYDGMYPGPATGSGPVASVTPISPMTPGSLAPPLSTAAPAYTAPSLSYTPPNLADLSWLTALQSKAIQ